MTRFRDDNRGVIDLCTPLLSQAIIWGTVGVVVFAWRRHKARKEREWLRHDYPALHVQHFGCPPESIPFNRAEAVETLWNSGQQNEMSRPDFALRCYTLAFQVADNMQMKNNIGSRIGYLQAMSAGNRYYQQ